MKKRYKVNIDKNKRQVPIDLTETFEEDLDFKLQLFENQLDFLKEIESKGFVRGIKLG